VSNEEGGEGPTDGAFEEGWRAPEGFGVDVTVPEIVAGGGREGTGRATPSMTLNKVAFKTSADCLMFNLLSGQSVRL
jgi:hypothetical protein